MKMAWKMQKKYGINMNFGIIEILTKILYTF